MGEHVHNIQLETGANYFKKNRSYHFIYSTRTKCEIHHITFDNLKVFVRIFFISPFCVCVFVCAGNSNVDSICSRFKTFAMKVKYRTYQKWNRFESNVVGRAHNISMHFFIKIIVPLASISYQLNITVTRIRRH